MLRQGNQLYTSRSRAEPGRVMLPTIHDSRRARPKVQSVSHMARTQLPTRGYRVVIRRRIVSLRSWDEIMTLAERWKNGKFSGDA